MGLFDKIKDAKDQAQQAVANSGGISGMMPSADDAGYAQLAQKLAASGVEAPAVINAIRPTGGGSEKIEFDVTITPAGGAAYDTTISQSMLPAQMEGISQGPATVKYDPDNPSAALLYGW